MSSSCQLGSPRDAESHIQNTAHLITSANQMKVELIKYNNTQFYLSTTYEQLYSNRGYNHTAFEAGTHLKAELSYSSVRVQLKGTS